MSATCTLFLIFFFVHSERSSSNLCSLSTSSLPNACEVCLPHLFRTAEDASKLSYVCGEARQSLVTQDG